MRLSAVLLARAIGLFDVNELDPRGKLFLPELIPSLADRFRFQEFPTKPEDFDLGKGIVFATGIHRESVIDNLTIYRDGIKADTRQSTEQSQQLVFDILEWLSSEHRLYFEPSMISRWSYVSNVAFQSNWDLDLITPAAKRLCENLSQILKETSESKAYHLTGLSFDFERVRSSMPISPFTIERRGKAPFAEGKYFSASPLNTGSHIRLLQEFEADVAGRRAS